MRLIETAIVIDAPPQAVWSVLDDLGRYPEWNRLIPELHGLTVVGETVEGRLEIGVGDPIPLSPQLIRIVGARELRWISSVPGDAGFTAEHYFILTPLGGQRTHLTHNEIFDGPGADGLFGVFEAPGGDAYRRFNLSLKERAERLARSTPSLHPAIDAGPLPTSATDPATTLRCLCVEAPVTLRLADAIRHPHLCGCSRCWKPAGALFAQIGCIPTDALELIAEPQKLAIVDPSQAIQRHACRVCGAHLFGRVPDRRHHFHGLDFIHPELADQAGPALEFAGFVSSIIGSGANPATMTAVRHRLATLGIAAHDAFSPEIMDLIAWHQVKLAQAASA